LTLFGVRVNVNCLSSRSALSALNQANAHHEQHLPDVPVLRYERPGSALLFRNHDMAIMAQRLKVLLMIRTGDIAALAVDRLDVIDFEERLAAAYLIRLSLRPVVIFPTCDTAPVVASNDSGTSRIPHVVSRDAALARASTPRPVLRHGALLGQREWFTAPVAPGFRAALDPHVQA